MNSTRPNNSIHPQKKRLHAILPWIAGAALTFSCTQQIPGSFRYEQVQDVFPAVDSTSTQIDMLWVIDNSASMDVSQDKLRAGFTTFARTYMKPTWDIRVGVITTDAYLANPAFQPYLNSTINGSVGYKSNHIHGRLGTWSNPASNPNLVNLTTGKFDSGVKYKELVPSWGPDYAKLIPGTHDGPISGLCVEFLPHFLRGVANCAVRDNQTQYSGTSNCLSPNLGAGESSLSQCVNTIQNDTVRSGRAIVSTKDSSIGQIIDDVMINLSAGTSGHGSERGLGSIIQLLNDNESSTTAFFRKNSFRSIIIIGDEDDQTMTLPDVIPAGFSPDTNYKCDRNSLIALNNNSVGNSGSLCCADGSCKYGAAGTSCSAKTVDGHTYTLSVCPDETKLKSVESIKTEIDTFFQTLDKSGAQGKTNYFVTAVVPLSGSDIQTLQASRNTSDTTVNTFITNAVDRGDRFLQFVEKVGNGSFSMSIADTNYSNLLDKIGREIASRRGRFTLSRGVGLDEDLFVQVIKSSGTIIPVDSSKFSVSGYTLQITDIDFILGLDPTDRILINYQPKGSQ